VTHLTFLFAQIAFLLKDGRDSISASQTSTVRSKPQSEAACCLKNLLCLLFASDRAIDTWLVCSGVFLAAFIAENTFQKLFDTIDIDKYVLPEPVKPILPLRTFSMVYEFMNHFDEFINQHSFFMVTGLVCHGGRSKNIAMEELDKALSDVPDLVLAESIKVRPEHSVPSHGDCDSSMLAGLRLHTSTSELVISVTYNRTH
jgi:hypothetical protein